MSTKTILINRKKWARGFKSSLLDNDSGKMCCLGFACKSFGVTSASINSRGAPQYIHSDIQREKLPIWLRDSYKDMYRLIRINDDSIIYSEEDREKEIIKIFKKHELNIKFVG